MPSLPNGISYGSGVRPASGATGATANGLLPGKPAFNMAGDYAQPWDDGAEVFDGQDANLWLEMDEGLAGLLARPAGASRREAASAGAAPALSDGGNYPQQQASELLHARFG